MMTEVTTGHSGSLEEENLIFGAITYLKDDKRQTRGTYPRQEEKRHEKMGEGARNDKKLQKETQDQSSLSC